MIQNDYERLRNRCLYLIAKMPRTEKDLRKKIEYGKYKYSKEVIDQVINNLKEYNYIDDYAYTKRFIELNIKNNSKKILEQKLFIKGVNQNIIKELLFEIDEEEEINVC
ncbi:MAG: RecX family transcriptional regulator, partial [Eubacteriales bacterium]|nr:RecX family transcriptional regulator [Eubacteriales bacterium]